MTVYTDKELPQKAREVQAQLEREIQKTCGCKQIGYGDWILCDYHKEKRKGRQGEATDPRDRE